MLPLLRWIRNHVRGFYAELGVYLLIGLAIAMAGLLLFGGVATLVARGATIRMDEAILLWMYEHHTPERDRWAEKLTDLGSTTVVVMVVLVSSAFLWVTRHRHWVALLWASMLGSALLSSTLKAIFDRDRPELWERGYAGEASFPSGHAMSAVVIYGTIAYLIHRMSPGRAMRRLTVAVTLFVIAVIGLSRIYLGVHYPSDVLAGYVAAGAWATFCALGVEAVRYFRR